MISEYRSKILLMTILFLAILGYEAIVNAKVKNSEAQIGQLTKVGQTLSKNLFKALCSIDVSLIPSKKDLCKGNVDIQLMCSFICEELKTEYNRCNKIVDGKSSVQCCACTNDLNAAPDDRSKYYWVTSAANYLNQNQTCGNGLKVVNQ